MGIKVTFQVMPANTPLGGALGRAILAKSSSKEEAIGLFYFVFENAFVETLERLVVPLIINAWIMQDTPWQGKLANSLRVFRTKNRGEMKLINVARSVDDEFYYADLIEYGSKPRAVNKVERENILKWATEKMQPRNPGAFANRVIRTIRFKGNTAHPVLKSIMSINRAVIPKHIAASAKRIIKSLS